MSRVADVYVVLRRRPYRTDDLEDLHFKYFSEVAAMSPPLGFSQHATPILPAATEGLIVISARVPAAKATVFMATYQERIQLDETIDRASYDDNLYYLFQSTNRLVDLPRLVADELPKAIVAFRAYNARIVYDTYSVVYSRTVASYAELRKDPTIDVDGRNNVFTLFRTQFWDRTLCKRAFNLTPEDIERRLFGHVKDVYLLNDGVYVVLNTEAEFTYEEFVELNRTVKPLLGLPI